jgi:hypothetical protein
MISLALTGRKLSSPGHSRHLSLEGLIGDCANVQLQICPSHRAGICRIAAHGRLVCHVLGLVQNRGSSIAKLVIHYCIVVQCNYGLHAVGHLRLQHQLEWYRLEIQGAKHHHQYNQLAMDTHRLRLALVSGNGRRLCLDNPLNLVQSLKGTRLVSETSRVPLFLVPFSSSRLLCLVVNQAEFHTLIHFLPEV